MAGKKDMKFIVKADEIMYTNISKSKNYNSASIGIKRGDNEYMSISYEWGGEGIPDFVMDLMSFMQANKEEVAAAIEAHNEELSAKKGKMPPWLNKDDDDKEGDSKDKKDKKDSKDKKKKEDKKKK